MPDFTSINAFTGAALGLIALLSAIAGWAKLIRPKWRGFKGDVTAGRDALLGRDAIIDSITGKELAPALPGIGQRMAAQEQSTELLVVTVTKLVAHQEHAEKLEKRVDNHDDRLKALEEAAVERVVAKAESTAAWRAMEAATKATPDMTIPPDPGD